MKRRCKVGFEDRPSMDVRLVEEVSASHANNICWTRHIFLCLCLSIGRKPH